MRRFAPLALIAVIALAGCGKKDSPTSPSQNTPAPTATVTRIIRLSPGDLAFGPVQLGQTKSLNFNVFNDGNAPLTFTGLIANNGLTSVFKVSPTSGTVPAGGGVVVTLAFTPTAATGYSGVVRVVGDQTTGNDGMNVGGVGTLDGIPVFTQTGSGASVFDIPTRITRIKISGDYGGSCENFIVHIAGKTVVNEILGSCSVATTGSHYEGTFLIAGGGVAEVLFSSGITWTFTEVR